MDAVVAVNVMHVLLCAFAARMLVCEGDGSSGVGFGGGVVAVCAYWLACSSRTWISLDIARFYEEHCQPLRAYNNNLSTSSDCRMFHSAKHFAIINETSIHLSASQLIFPRAPVTQIWHFLFLYLA